MPPTLILLRALTVLFALLVLYLMRRGLCTRRLAYYMLVLLYLPLALSAGCVGGNSNGTRTGTTNVTVTATAGSLSHTTTVMLTVQ